MDRRSTDMTETRTTRDFPSNPTVADFMTDVPATIDATFSLVDALDRMHSDNIRHLPVLNDRERLIGLLSSRDIFVAAEGDPSALANKTVMDAMTSSPYTCSPDTPLADVIYEIESRRLGSVVVMDDTKIVGMFTTIDAMRALRGALAGHLVEATVVPRHRADENNQGLDPKLHRRGEGHLGRSSLRSSMRWALFHT